MKGGNEMIALKDVKNWSRVMTKYGEAKVQHWFGNKTRLHFEDCIVENSNNYKCVKYIIKTSPEDEGR